MNLTVKNHTFEGHLRKGDKKIAVIAITAVTKK